MKYSCSDKRNWASNMLVFECKHGMKFTDGFLTFLLSTWKIQYKISVDLSKCCELKPILLHLFLSLFSFVVESESKRQWNQVFCWCISLNFPDSFELFYFWVQKDVIDLLDIKGLSVGIYGDVCCYDVICEPNRYYQFSLTGIWNQIAMRKDSAKLNIQIALTFWILLGNKKITIITIIRLLQL